MKKIWILFLLSMSSTHLNAQTNLVPNASFEIFDTCAQEAGKILYAVPWFRPTMPVIYTINDGTSDYFNACFDTAFTWYNVMDVPKNFWGYQNAKTGNGYSGICTYVWGLPAWEYKEYIEVKLDSPLTAGIKYYVNFYVSMADSCQYGTDDIGAYISMDSVLSNNFHALPDIPQVENPSGNILSDRLNWTLIAGTYVAQGGEQFITIGNFKDDANTDTVFIPGGGTTSTGDKSSYWYIDNVCVSSDSMTCVNAANGIELNYEEKVEIYPNPTNKKIFIKTKVSPNAIVSVFNCMGEELLSEKLNVEKTEIDLSEYDEGIYFVRLQVKDQQVTKKIILIK